jgi:hypothetical protein
MIMEHWWNNNYYGNTEMLGEKPTPLLIALLQIPYVLLWIKVGFSRQEAGDKP